MLSIGEGRESETCSNTSEATIPEGEWECVTMDFVGGFPKTSQGLNNMWVIMNLIDQDFLFHSYMLSSVLRGWNVSIFRRWFSLMGYLCLLFSY